MTQITSSVDTSAILERIGVGRNEELRQSNRRRRYLEKLSRVITPRRPTVDLDGSVPTAHVNQHDDEPSIAITTREFDQTHTELSRDVFDMTVQEALLVHEIGHVLYTDSEAFQRTLSRVNLRYKGAYKRLWNSLEDGAIEEQLRQKFNVADELHVLNANLMADKAASEMSGETPEIGSQEVDLYGAVSIAVLDLAVFDSGRFARLRDENDDSLTVRSEKEAELLEELLPIMKNAIGEVLTEPDPIERTEIIYEFWVEVRMRLDDAEEEGHKQGEPQEDGEDSQSGDGNQTLDDLFGGDDSESEEGDGQSGGGSTIMIVDKPDDTENDNVGGAMDADRLDDIDREELEDALSDSADPESDTSDYDEESNSGPLSGSESDSGEEADSDSSDASSEREQNIEESRREQLRQEGSEVEGAQELIDEIQEYSDVLSDMAGSGAAPGRGDVSITIPDSRNLNDFSRWNQAEARSRQIAQLLKSSLREERRSRRVKNQRRGRFDRSRMVNAARGSARVFESEEEGDDKDYDALIVLDRSGSMRGEPMELAEDAILALALALERVSVGVSILGMAHNDAQLENAFGRDLENDRGVLLSEETGGGTPLAKTLAVGRRRLENKGESDNPFMIVVTDGKPHDTRAYLDELDKVNFPVLGVYVDTEKDDSDYFHRQVHVDRDNIEEATMRLAREAML